MVIDLKKLENTKSISESWRITAKELAKELAKKYELKVDMEQIIKAIGLPKGHWNKCPNGHYYVIADCGGAMVESKCPDCKSVIGGSNHSLAAGNQFANELGG